MQCHAMSQYPPSHRKLSLTIPSHKATVLPRPHCTSNTNGRKTATASQFWHQVFWHRKFKTVTDLIGRKDTRDGRVA